MNKTFIDNNFLLRNKYAQELYHDFVKDLPIIDYHCHLPPVEIAENRSFENITQIWLNGDHYKWRAMRTIGVDEQYITGGASDRDKFRYWAKTVPYTLRNPLYHWTHLELLRYYGIEELLDEQSAGKIYDQTAEQLKQPAFQCKSLIKKMNVEAIGTTEDPIDDLRYHKIIKDSEFKTVVSTAFRPDKAVLIDHAGFNGYMDQLEKASGIEIRTYENLCEALTQRLEYFHERGCRLSDHGLNQVSYAAFSDQEITSIFYNKRIGKELTPSETEKYKTAILLFLGRNYHRLGWVQQYHLGALRNNNQRMLGLLGPDTGWDSVGDYPQAEKLSKFLNALDAGDTLTKTILYNLNPADNEVMATMIGNFNDGSSKGKIQWGSGWWFLDQKDGMEKQLNTLSNMGLISCFIGMLTDSRSFMSYPRHEYFRRILCNLFGQEIENGDLPKDMNWIGKIASDICYHNAKEYFNFNT